MKTFADKKKEYLAEKTISVGDMVENLVAKGENGGFQHFLHFPQCFQKAFSAVVLKFSLFVKDIFFLVKHVLVYELHGTAFILLSLLIILLTMVNPFSNDEFSTLPN